VKACQSARGTRVLKRTHGTGSTLGTMEGPDAPEAVPQLELRVRIDEHLGHVCVAFAATMLCEILCWVGYLVRVGTA
jgi:hypothetical protein